MLNIKTFYFNPFEERCILAWDESSEALIVDPGCYAAGEIETLEAAIEEQKLKVKYILLTHAHFDHTFGVSDLVRKYGVPVLMASADRVIIENNKFFCGSFALKCPDTWYASGAWESFQSGAKSGAEASTTSGTACAQPAAKASTTSSTACAQPAAKAITQPSAQPGTPAVPQVLTLADGTLIPWGEGRTWEVLSTPGHTPGGVCYLDRAAKLLLCGDTLFAGAIGRTDNRWGDYDALIDGIFEKLMTLEGDITAIPGHGPTTTIADERTKNPFLMPFNEPFEDNTED